MHEYSSLWSFFWVIVEFIDHEKSGWFFFLSTVLSLSELTFANILGCGFWIGRNHGSFKLDFVPPSCSCSKVAGLGGVMQCRSNIWHRYFGSDLNTGTLLINEWLFFCHEGTSLLWTHMLGLWYYGKRCLKWKSHVIVSCWMWVIPELYTPLYTKWTLHSTRRKARFCLPAVHWECSPSPAVPLSMQAGLTLLQEAWLKRGGFSFMKDCMPGATNFRTDAH